MANVYGRNDLFFCAKQTAYDAIRNTEGAASLAAADACRHSSLSITPIRSRLQPTDKESTNGLAYIDRSRAGRMSATASLSLPLQSSSGATAPPDCGPILESAFGKETIGATTVTYGPDGTQYMSPTSPVTCELWGMNSAGVRGACAYGALVNRLQISGGQDSVNLSADFVCRYAITQDRFTNASSSEKGGLTAWPSVPASQTYTGSELNGFTGVFTADATTYNLRNFTITMNMNRAYDVNHFAADGSEFFPIAPFELIPEILLDFSIWSTTDAALTTLLGKLANRTAFDVTIQVGSVAGGIYTFSLNNLIIPDGANGDGYRHEDGDDRKAISISGLRAQATNASTRDEIVLVKS